jgi:hypothetical protein
VETGFEYNEEICFSDGKLLNYSFVVSASDFEVADLST